MSEEKRYGYIYKITNLINGKIYIGQHQHRKKENNYFGGGVIIKKAIEKYGKENFKKEILQEYNTFKEANELEKYYIKLYNSRDPKIGYNIDEGGKNGERDERTKKLLSTKLKGKKLSTETRLKISNSLKGKKLPKEIYLKNSQYFKKLKWIHKDNIQKRVLEENLKEYLLNGWELGYSKEIKNKISISAKNKIFLQKPNYKKGFKHSEEIKKKISQSSLNMWKTREHKILLTEEDNKKRLDNLRKALKGNYFGYPSKEKYMECHNGESYHFKHSEETKKKMSEAAKRRYKKGK